MRKHLPGSFHLHPDVSNAIARGLPIVALESAVITHGLPRPLNHELALEMEEILRQRGICPATVAVINGKFTIGLTPEELEQLSEDESAIKINLRNIGIALSQRLNGGTTVAATLFAAKTTGIKVFATGGIGGVHRGNSLDISSDLNALEECPVLVVCAGAKAILDLPATLEALETRGIPVIGYRTDEFPAFYSRESGLKLDFNASSAEMIAEIAEAHWQIGSQQAVLVGNPIPAENALNSQYLTTAIEEAVKTAELAGIHGTPLTPYLLERLNQATSGESLKANVALLKNNAVLAAEIARHLYPSGVVSY